MLFACDERNRLWAVYDAALRLYIEATAAMVECHKLGHHREFRSATEDAAEKRVFLQQQRAALRQHCDTHACDS